MSSTTLPILLSATAREQPEPTHAVDPAILTNTPFGSIPGTVPTKNETTPKNDPPAPPAAGLAAPPQSGAPAGGALDTPSLDEQSSALAKNDPAPRPPIAKTSGTPAGSTPAVSGTMPLDTIPEKSPEATPPSSAPELAPPGAPVATPAVPPGTIPPNPSSQPPEPSAAPPESMPAPPPQPSPAAAGGRELPGADTMPNQPAVSYHTPRPADNEPASTPAPAASPAPAPAPPAGSAVAVPKTNPEPTVSTADKLRKYPEYQQSVDEPWRDPKQYNWDRKNLEYWLVCMSDPAENAKKYKQTRFTDEDFKNPSKFSNLDLWEDHKHQMHVGARIFDAYYDKETRKMYGWLGVPKEHPLRQYIANSINEGRRPYISVGYDLKYDNLVMVDGMPTPLAVKDRVPYECSWLSSDQTPAFPHARIFPNVHRKGHAGKPGLVSTQGQRERAGTQKNVFLL